MKEALGLIFYIGLAAVLLVTGIRAAVNVVRALLSRDYRELLTEAALLALCIAFCLLAIMLELKEGMLTYNKMF